MNAATRHPCRVPAASPAASATWFDAQPRPTRGGERYSYGEMRRAGGRPTRTPLGMMCDLQQERRTLKARSNHHQPLRAARRLRREARRHVRDVVDDVRYTITRLQRARVAPGAGQRSISATAARNGRSAVQLDGRPCGGSCKCARGRCAS